MKHQRKRGTCLNCGCKDMIIVGRGLCSGCYFYKDIRKLFPLQKKGPKARCEVELEKATVNSPAEVRNKGGRFAQIWELPHAGNLDRPN